MTPVRYQLCGRPDRRTLHVLRANCPDAPAAFFDMQPDARDLCARWIALAVRDGFRVRRGLTSRTLWEDFTREMLVAQVSHAAFKGALVMAEHFPADRRVGDWRMRVRPSYSRWLPPLRDLGGGLLKPGGFTAAVGAAVGGTDVERAELLLLAQRVREREWFAGLREKLRGAP